jgi:hypothetical protein
LDTEKSFLEKLYEKLWTAVGGRPWTHIIRDQQKAAPLLFILIFFFIGVALAKLAGKRWWWVALGILFGVLLGHFWW